MPPPTVTELATLINALREEVALLKRRVETIESGSVGAADLARVEERVRSGALDMGGRLATERGARGRAIESAVNPLRQSVEQLAAANTAQASTSVELRRLITEAQATLTTRGEEILALQRRMDAADGDALFLSNLAYAYALMASHWKVARDHVRQVASVPTTGQTLLKVATGAFVFGLQTAFACFTGGLSTTLFHAVIAPAFSTFGKLGASVLSYNVQSDSGPTTFSGQTRDTATMDVAKDVWSPAAGAVFDLLGDKLIPDGYDGPGGDGSLTDPFEFFLDLEKELRHVAMELTNARVVAPGRSSETSARVAEMETRFEHAKVKTQLAALKDGASSYWRFLFEPVAVGSVAGHWAMLSSLLAVSMRRLAWRLYCREQWSNTVWNFSICGAEGYVNPPELRVGAEAADAWKSDPASEWPYKAWAKQGGSWPPHWEKICGDYRGPEHVPDHPFNAADQTTATKLDKRKAWISMAAVQCCQVKRSVGTFSRAYRIDLEKNIHFAGISGDGDELEDDGGVTLVQGYNDYDLVFGEYDRHKDVLDQINTRGGTVVRIAQVRFGTASNRVSRALLTSTGKKGILFSPNRSDDDLMPTVSGGTRVTVYLTTTSRTTEAAILGLVGPLAKGGHVTRDAAKGCPTGNATWDATKTSKTLATHLRQWTNLVAPTAAGVYCVTLDAKADKRAGSSRKFFVASEWWFRVT